MKVVMGSLIGFALGALLAALTITVWSHLSSPSYIPEEIRYEALFELADVHIEQAKFHCENAIGSRVGAILGHIMKSNSNNYLNKVNESCSGNVCQISYATCTPWQTDSCGSTILRFNFLSDGQIDPLSFQCLQVP